MADNVGAIVLAAGFSNRFGSIKLCAELESGATVFEQTLNRIQSAIGNYKVVTRPELASLLNSFDPDLQIFHAAEKGMGATLAYGIGFAEEWDACLICLADMPFIQAETYRQLADQLNENNIVIPYYQQQAGNPVGFGKQFFSELSQLSGDAGGRPVVQAHKDAVVRVGIEDAAVLYDIDTPADLEKFQQMAG
ncbi:MAG: nucleotidyltransferase family protein [Gammaproteobacteria bacterium]|nr:nucleotidyltransferase family protein [Gammaproteobacteria bacterium]MDD9960454.1 nucleotidyltransferase family protein [Gammaproteobacteria bacterium]